MYSFVAITIAGPEYSYRSNKPFEVCYSGEGARVDMTSSFVVQFNIPKPISQYQYHKPATK